ncbi:hypothetical protein B566_EDAN016330 [Ephemera danica]|nr:hypothetical protein B566_EDAN016330 [Ephemera danica]
MMALENLVLVRFNNDTMVEPVDSEWFGFYKPGQALEVQSLQESTLYKEDRLGLQVLNKTGRLHFLAVDGDHLQFTEDWFDDHITKQFLVN